MSKYDENDPEVIRAQAEAKARVLEARAKLHPLTQVTQTLLDQLNTFVSNLGCLVIIILFILLFFGVDILKLLGIGG